MAHDAHQLADIARLVKRLTPALAKQHEPEIVGAALAELVALFIAGHAPSLRSEARRFWLKHVDNLVPVIVEELIEQGLMPEHWKKEFDA